LHSNHQLSVEPYEAHLLESFLYCVYTSRRVTPRRNEKLIWILAQHCKWMCSRVTVQLSGTSTFRIPIRRELTNHPQGSMDSKIIRIERPVLGFAARAMFDIDQFIFDCKEALRRDQSQSSVREVVARAVAGPTAVLRALGEPQKAEMQTLYRADNLTILNVIWAPWMTLLPHNHQMWAVIGIYTGREDNIFWRRAQEGGTKVEAAGAKALVATDAVQLGDDIIHSVTNPIPRFTGAIHVYGGDFFGLVGRSEWNAETLLEQSCDGASMARRFEEANAFLKKT